MVPCVILLKPLKPSEQKQESQGSSLQKGREASYKKGTMQKFSSRKLNSKQFSDLDQQLWSPLGVIPLSEDKDFMWIMWRTPKCIEISSDTHQEVSSSSPETH